MSIASDVVIYEPVRSPVGRLGEVFSRLAAAELATTAFQSPPSGPGS